MADKEKFEGDRDWTPIIESLSNIGFMILKVVIVIGVAIGYGAFCGIMAAGIGAAKGVEIAMNFLSKSNGQEEKDIV